MRNLTTTVDNEIRALIQKRWVRGLKTALDKEIRKCRKMKKELRTLLVAKNPIGPPEDRVHSWVAT